MSNLVSVIIPTIQKRLEILEELIEILSRDESVSEIIVINNKPELPISFESTKVKVYTPESNLYVNKSWNKGVELAENQNFCLMNDDLIVGENFCNRIVNSDLFNAPTTGLVGMGLCMLKGLDEEVVFNDSANPQFSIQTLHKMTGDWGAIIFGKKENYYEIPEELKILCGDNYLLYQNKLAGKTNYNIENLPCRHVHSASCASPEFKDVVAQDILKSNDFIGKEDSASNSYIPLENLTFGFKLDGNICMVKVDELSINLCIKYKKNNELIPKEELIPKLEALLSDKEFSQIVIDRIIAVIYSCN